ncbi:MAG: geranylgeranylglycerol-phosphate geranylgeranyltransferase [Chitinophagaceae bacterium]|nr:geranylgeranylglycerol-phosphate geranylgeranyltransferase [Chitinophagaceae bacterium]
MRLVLAFLKLVRFPNLLFIALTQILFQFCIFQPLYKSEIPADDFRHFILILFASLFIAAGGYIINDYFDINIDEVNRPARLVVDRVIHRRWAIAWHFMLSGAGILLSVFAFPFPEKWYLILANILCVVLLWFYSARFKKMLLIGNVVISLLTSWTILVLFFSKLSFRDAFEADHSRFFRIAFLYAGFAFIISLIREAVKDMEDMAGDARYGCKTMPVMWGVQTTKVYVAIWLTVMLSLLLLLQIYVLQFRWWLAIAYCIPMLVVPAGVALWKLKQSRSTEDFRKLSRLAKWIMLAGILSMLFFCIYL